MVSTHWSSRVCPCGPPISIRVGAAIAAISLTTAGASFAQDGDVDGERSEATGPIVPVHEEPHHRQVFQSGPMRILDLQLPPDDRSWFHSHDWPVLYMTLSTSAVRMENLGADPASSGRGASGRGGSAGNEASAAPRTGAGQGAAGNGVSPPRPAAPARTAPSGPRAPRATSTTSYLERPITHRIENVGEGLFRAMVVINETAGDDSSSVEAAGFDSEPELTNPWFRSYRVTLDPGESTAVHSHDTPVVIFQATDGTGSADGPMDWEFNQPGQWAFFDDGAEHVIRNRGEETMQLLEIEVRGQ